MVGRRAEQRRPDFMHIDVTGSERVRVGVVWPESSLPLREGKNEERGRNIDSFLCHLTSSSSAHEITAGR